MKTEALLAQVLERGVQLWAEGEVLRFRARRQALTSELRQELAENKSEVLARLGQVNKYASASVAQQQLWFLEQLEQTRGAYNVLWAVGLRGRLDVPALEAALAEVVRRHESLRTRFTTLDGRLVQVIDLHPRGVELPLVDLSGLLPGARWATGRRLSSAEVRHPFDLARGPLLKATLLRLDAGVSERRQADHVLLVGLHHTVADGWSLAVFDRELAALYSALSRRHRSPLPEPARQYADFAVWQHEWLSGKAAQEQLAWWRRQLEAVPMLRLPTDRPRSGTPSYRGGTWQDLSCPQALTEALRQRGRDTGASLFMTLLAAFMALLHRLTGQGDVAVGSPIANRSREESEDLVGPFVNMLVLHGDLSDPGPLAFSQLLRRLRHHVLEAYARQELPFEKLVAELRGEASPAYDPLFQVGFVLQNVSGTEPEFPGLVRRPIPLELETARFDLELLVWEKGSTLSGSFAYRSELFDSATIGRWSSSFVNLTRAIAADPECQIRDIALCSPAQHHQLLIEWNDTSREAAGSLSLTELLGRQRARTPQAVAVVEGCKHLSYREMHRRADRLARFLRHRGVVPELPVGVFLEGSVELALAFLGVLKAGGVYLPLDPAYPEARRCLMLEDARAPILLTMRELRDRFGPTPARVLCLDDGVAPGAGQETASLAPATADSLFCLVYTSGSTGRPKGIMLPQRTLLNLVLWHLEKLWGPARILQLASPSFDASLHEMCAAWASGAALILLGPGADLRREPAELARFLERQAVGKLILPVALLRELVRIRSTARGLREVLSTGEQLALTPAMAAAFRPSGCWPRCELRNHYGPSESHVVTDYRCRGEPVAWPARPPIGRPIANTAVYLLDPWCGTVPIGVHGELHIGGQGTREQLARGYWRRPGLTSERFVPNPFGPPGTRLYATGDLARYLAGGDLEFLGRIDHQVKVRGFRVEPGEIEATLDEHPDIREAAVVAGSEQGDTRLTAFVATARARELEASELRAYLGARLPDYMVPAAILALPALPLTPNGKVDRAALGRAAARRAPETAAAPQHLPRAGTEEILAGIWQDVLVLEAVGREDDFFALGGHSLLVMRVSSRVRDVFDVDLPVRVFFEAPTIAALAGRLEEAPGAGSRGTGAPRPVPRDGALPLSPAQERLWFLDRLVPENPVYNLPMALRLTGPLHSGALEAALNEILRRHESLRTTFAEAGEQMVQRIHQTTPRVLPVVTLEGLAAAPRQAEARRLADREATRCFDLTTGPLWRGVLLRLEAREHVLLLNQHHIVSDEWSLGLLHGELSALYGAFREGLGSPLKELAVQYADFAAWQRVRLRSEALRDELAWWRRQIGENPPRLRLPTDRPRPSRPVFQGDFAPSVLGGDLSAASKRLSRQEGTTLTMTLLAAFYVLLWRLTGQTRLPVGVPLANRGLRAIEDLIGFFVNTLVMIADLSAPRALTFRELLARVRETALGAYSHQDLPFERLVGELEPERDLSGNPLFQVIFDFRNTTARPPELAGLTVETLACGPVVAHFDLELNFWEGPQGLTGGWIWDRALFDATTLLRTRSHYRTLLEGLVKHPEACFSELAWLRGAELQQLLVEWNDDSPTPADNLVELFERGLEPRLDAMALVGEQTALMEETVLMEETALMSYGELRRRAAALGRRLSSRGVAPEVRVALLLESSVDLVVGMMAILKAGGAYVPLDPSQPSQRLAYVLEDSQAPVVLTSKPLIADLPAGSLRPDVRIVCLEDAENGPWDGEETLPADAGNLAYVIYTSGSTGRPKGTRISHGNVTRLVSGTQPLFGFTARDVWTLFHSCAFDASVWEIWGALIHGARLVVISQRVRQSPELFYRRLVRERVTILHQIPAAFFQLAETIRQRRSEEADRLSLRWVLLGGERLEPWRLAGCWKHLGPGPLRWANLYGITETTVLVNWRPAPAGRYGPPG